MKSRVTNEHLPNYYANPKSVDLAEGFSLRYPQVLTVADPDNFYAYLKTASGEEMRLDRKSFSNLTSGFGITGKYAMRMTNEELNGAIKTISSSKKWKNCFAVGLNNSDQQNFTRDIKGLENLSNLVEQYGQRTYSTLGVGASTIETMNVDFKSADPIFFDGIVSYRVNFRKVEMLPYTELLRQICTNGATELIADDKGKPMSISDYTIITDHLHQRIEGVRDSVEMLASAKVIETDAFMYAIETRAQIPTHIAKDAKRYNLKNLKNELELEEKEEACPFGIVNAWDYVNLYTYAMHEGAKALFAKHKLQARLWRHCTNEEFIEKSAKEGLLQLAKAA